MYYCHIKSTKCEVRNGVNCALFSRENVEGAAGKTAKAWDVMDHDGSCIMVAMMDNVSWLQ